jgi:hypothetical protein
MNEGASPSVVVDKVGRMTCDSQVSFSVFLRTLHPEYTQTPSERPACTGHFFHQRCMNPIYHGGHADGLTSHNDEWLTPGFEKKTTSR